MNILMTGGTGLLGDYMIRERPKGINLIITHMDTDTFSYYNGYPKAKKYKKLEILRLDAGSFHSMNLLFKEKKPDVVIHAAGFSSPDEVERNNPQFVENVHLTHNIAVLCKKYKTKMVFISSNAVYRGNLRLYSERAPQLPINDYGLSKLLGEKITASVPNSLIIRLTMMYGNLKIFTKARSNIALQVIENVKAKKNIWMFQDIFCKPLYAGQAARAIYSSLERQYEVLDNINISGRDSMSVYDFANHVCDVYNLNHRLIHPIEEEKTRKSKKLQALYGLNISAIRPRDTSFNTAKMEGVLGIRPLTVSVGLQVMRAEL